MNSNSKNYQNGRQMVRVDGGMATLDDFMKVVLKSDDASKLRMMQRLYVLNPFLLAPTTTSPSIQGPGRGRRKNQNASSATHQPPPPPPPPPPPTPTPYYMYLANQHLNNAPPLNHIHVQGDQLLTTILAQGAKPMDSTAQYRCHMNPAPYNQSAGTPSFMPEPHQQPSWYVPPLGANEKAIVMPPSDPPSRSARSESEASRATQLPKLRFTIGGKPITGPDSLKDVSQTAAIIPQVEDSVGNYDDNDVPLPSPDMHQVDEAPAAPPRVPRTIKITVSRNNNNRPSEPSETRRSVRGSSVPPSPVSRTVPAYTTPPHVNVMSTPSLTYPIQPSSSYLPQAIQPSSSFLPQAIQPSSSYLPQRFLPSPQFIMGHNSREDSLNPKVTVLPDLISTQMRTIDVRNNSSMLPLAFGDANLGLPTAPIPISRFEPEQKMVTVMPTQVSDSPDDYTPLDSIDWEELNSVPLTEGYWPLHATSRVSLSPLSPLKASYYQKKAMHGEVIVGNTKMARMELFRGHKRTHSAIESSEESVDLNDFREYKRRKIIDSESIDEPASTLLDLTINSQRSNMVQVNSSEEREKRHAVLESIHEDVNEAVVNEDNENKHKEKIRLVPEVTKAQASLLLNSRDEEEEDDEKSLGNNTGYCVGANEIVEAASPALPSMESSDPVEMQSMEMDVPPSQLITEPKDEEKEAAKRLNAELEAEEVPNTSDEAAADLNNPGIVNMLKGFLDMEDKIKAKQEELNDMFAEYQKKRGQLEHVLHPVLQTQGLKSMRPPTDEKRN